MNKLPTQKLDPRLIALDLDDTLLTKDLTIAPPTVQALRDAAKKGIYIVPCSGRAENGILPFAKMMELDDIDQGRYIIAINGSSIYDRKEKKTIFEKKIDAETLTFAYKEALARGFSCQVYSADTTFANVDNEFTRIDAKLCNLKIEIVEDFEKFLQSGHTKMLIPGEESKIAEFCSFLKSALKGKAEVFTSKPYFLEIMPFNWGKGQAIDWLSDYLKLEKNKTMAFGDSMNDESMIRSTTFSVAMCNGLEYIQNVAKFVTRKSNNDDGIGDFLREFVL